MKTLHKHTHPLDIVCVTSSALRKIEKDPYSWTFTSTHPLDIVCVTSSALRKIEKHPHSWTFTSTHPLDIACVTSSTFQGGGAIGPGHEHFAIGFQYSSSGGGGGDHPCPPPWMDPPLDKRKPNQKIVPVPLLLNLYLPIELRASYLMRSALLATYCSSGGIPWPSLSNL